MNGILLIDKEKGITSRAEINKLCKIFNTKKIGHTGTLDPIATGILVVCIGKYTKLVDLITSYEKEYIATAILGIETDTLDITGNTINIDNVECTKKEIIKVLNSFVGKYIQEVPLYSAVKINGNRLYDYARKNEKIDLPKREVEIKNIQLLEYNKLNNELKFKVVVSKGTYIRSLIRDIGNKLNVPITMKELRRTKQGKFKVENCNTIYDIEDNKFKLLSVENVLDYPIINIKDEELLKKIKNGALINNIYNDKYIMFKYKHNIIAIYEIYSKNNSYMKPYIML